MNDVEEVKSRLDIAQVIGKYVTLKKAGKNLKGLCPFHGEKTPSFMVNPDRQVFHCFGCGKGGSVIDFIMEYQHLDFREALEELADQAGVTLTKHVSTTPEEHKKELLLEIHHLAHEYFHFLYTKHPIAAVAREYVEKRGVSPKVQETFGFGYSPNSWDSLARYLKKKGYDTDILVDSGLVIASQKGGYDRFRGRLMFPLKDHRGRVVGFSGRILDPDAEGAKYINSPETAIYTKGNMLFALDITKGEIQKSETAVLMEGEFDVLSSFQAGIGNVVAIKGTAVTEAQVKLLKRFASKIIFALDSDVAGDAAARRGIEIADRAGLEIHVAKMPFGKDPDEVARTEPHLLKKAISEAQTIYDYYVTSTTKRFDVQSPYGKKHVSQELFPILQRITNPVVQNHYVRQVADLLHVSESVVQDGMKKETKQLSSQEDAGAIEEKKVDEDTYERYFLSLLLQGDTKELMEDFEDTFDSTLLGTSSIRQIIERLKDHLRTTTHFFVKDFIESLPKELLPTVDHALLVDTSGVTESPEVFSRTWQMTIREVKKKALKREIARLSHDMKDATEDVQAAIGAKLGDLAAKLRLLEKQG